MAYLLDTSVLARLANSNDPNYATAARAVSELHQPHEVLHITPQNLIEFRNLATRPIAVNGLGLTAVESEAITSRIEATFSLLPETPNIFPAWKAIVQSLGVIGKQVHDARLVAVCHAHSVTHLLTFNVAHFARMAGFGPGVVVVDAASV